MTTFIFILALYAAIAGLAAYARRDRFAGPAMIAEGRDALGSLSLRGRVD